ncbi:MAG: YicC family protein [Clostridia bacterium]|nr:YicC family protein [Clostridia bacterium]
MLKSMTGYGRGEASGCGWLVTVELKAVNQRYLDVVVRLPRYYLALEEKVRQQIKGNLNRGRVEAIISISDEKLEKQPLTVDTDLAMTYYNALKELAHNMGIPVDITADKLLALPEVLKANEPEWDEETLWPVMAAALDKALAGLLAMRQQEGQRLQADLEKRVRLISSQVEVIQQQAADVPRTYALKLKERIGELLEGVPLDPGRLEMEVAMIAERADITEEIVRLKSHLQQISGVMTAGGAVGRRLDFILQEMWREINTIGAKAANEYISHLVVEVKCELEKMREQVQNVE